MARTPDAEYWKGRFLQLEEASHRDALETMGVVDDAYRAATRELDGEISTWYRRFADNNGIVSMAEARRRLNSKELEEFKWTVNDYIKHGQENGVTADWSKELENASARWHISRFEAIKTEMRNTVEKLYGKQEAEVRRLLEDTYQETYGRAAFEVQKGIGIGWNVPKLNERAIRIAVSRPWGTDGKNFSTRIWGNKDRLIGELNTEFARHLLRGGKLDDVVDAIETKMNSSHFAAKRLVYTEHAYIRSEADRESFEATDVEQVQFVATLDERTSEICRTMDGSIIDMKDYEPGVTVPPMHPLCRSVTVPYFASLEGVGRRAARDQETGKTYYVPANMTYREWEKTSMTAD